MKSLALVMLMGITVAFAENYEFVFPEKIETQIVSSKASPELVKLANTINKKCPLEPVAPKKRDDKSVAKDDSVKNDSFKKASGSKDVIDGMGEMFSSLFKMAEAIKRGEHPALNVALEGVSVDDKYIIFSLRHPENVPDSSLYSLLTLVSMSGAAIIEGGQATYGKKDNPFSEKNLRTIVKNDVNLVLRYVTRNGKYVDAIVEKSQLPIPYIETPHKNMKKIGGVPSVEIGNQIWMAQNVNKRTPKSKCYEKNEKNCARYGRLYPIEEARKVCPAGWHLPSSTEFLELGKVAGDMNALRSRNYEEWGRGGEGTDVYGFNAHPSGKVNGKLEFSGGYVQKKKVKPKPGSIHFEFSSNARVAYFWTSDLPPSENKNSSYSEVVEGTLASLGFFTMNGNPIEIRKSIIARKHGGKLDEGSNPQKEKLWLSVRCIKNN